ncbi:hypothetical protein Efla_002653 [Eimeria flavescens]
MKSAALTRARSAKANTTTATAAAAAAAAAAGALFAAGADAEVEGDPASRQERGGLPAATAAARAAGGQPAGGPFMASEEERGNNCCAQAVSAYVHSSASPSTCRLHRVMRAAFFLLLLCGCPGFRLSPQASTSFGLGWISLFFPLPASAAQCAVNVCVNGACYEHNSAQVCVCSMPFKGPTCAERVSLCSSDCGVRPTSGIDCNSALCSLGRCTDTATSPYFQCACGDFFSGANCENPTNPCTSVVNPCGHGTCSFAPGRGSGSVSCECDDNWQVAPGATAVTVKWGDSEVVMGPPCTVQISRGIARISFTLSSGELIVWWTVQSPRTDSKDCGACLAAAATTDALGADSSSCCFWSCWCKAAARIDAAAAAADAAATQQKQLMLQLLLQLLLQSSSNT